MHVLNINEELNKPLWDSNAVKEIVINAIVHNDYTNEDTPVFELYDNRLEITSYGGLISGLTKEEFFKAVSRPRNRELMRIFKDLELVEHLGSGISRILSVYNKSIFEISDNYLRAIIPFNLPSISKSSEKSSEKNVTRILKIISKNPAITTKELSRKLKISSRAVEKHIKRLRENNKIKRIGADNGGYWKII